MFFFASFSLSFIRKKIFLRVTETNLSDLQQQHQLVLWQLHSNGKKFDKKNLFIKVLFQVLDTFNSHQPKLQSSLQHVVPTPIFQRWVSTSYYVSFYWDLIWRERVKTRSNPKPITENKSPGEKEKERSMEKLSQEWALSEEPLWCLHQNKNFYSAAKEENDFKDFASLIAEYFS